MLCRDEYGPEIYEENHQGIQKQVEDLERMHLNKKNRKKKEANESNNQILNRNVFFRKNLRVKTDGLTFGICKLIFVLLSLVFGTAIIQYFFYTAIYPDARKLANLIKLYTIGCDGWNTFYLMHHTFLATILWNNTVDYYGFGNSQKAYE
jgi:hypothetical protein